MNNDLLKISLDQGKQFKTYQNKIKKGGFRSKRQSFKTKNGKEGFITSEQELLVRPPDEGYNQIIKNESETTKNINSVNQAQLNELNSMQTKFLNLMQKYNNIQQSIGDSSLETINRMSSNNPYANKNIRFNNGTICYVTSQGTAKPYLNLDIFNLTAGKNGCPSGSEIVNIDLPYLTSYSPGSVIPTTPTLVVGTNMVQGQSCGSEGKNIYVSKLVNNPSSSYVGCYNDKPMDQSSIDDSQRAMIWNPNALGYTTYDKCQEYALANGYQYFGMQDYRSDGTSACLVSNDIGKTEMYGDGSIQINSLTPIWSTGTSQPGNIMTLSAESGINVLNNSVAVYVSNFNGIKFYSDCGFSGQQTNAPLGQHNVVDIGFPNDTLSSIIVPNNFGIVIFRDNLGTEPSITLGPGQYACLVDNGWNDLATSYTAYYNGNCYLMLQDDGNVILSTGNPGSDYNVIWTTGTNGKQAGPNPMWEATKGKYGRNFLQLGEGLNPGEWIGSTDGSMRLIMQTDGNLVLFTSERVDGCSVNSSGKQMGGSWMNAVYEFANSGFKDNIGKLGFVDENDTLYEYPSSNARLTQSYTKFDKYDAYGADLPSAAYGGATIDRCKTSCNSRNDCYGFAYDFQNNVCYPKSNAMWPYGGPSRPLDRVDTYIKNQVPISVPLGATNETISIDSAQYQFYNKGTTLPTQYGLINATESDKAELTRLQNKMKSLTNQISELINKFSSGTNNSENQGDKNLNGLINYQTEMQKIENRIDTLNSTSDTTLPKMPESFVNYGYSANNNIEKIVQDSDIAVLQKNYEYLLWTILATGSVLVAMNINKN